MYAMYACVRLCTALAVTVWTRVGDDRELVVGIRRRTGVARDRDEARLISRAPGPSIIQQDRAGGRKRHIHARASNSEREGERETERAAR